MSAKVSPAAAEFCDTHIGHKLEGLARARSLLDALVVERNGLRARLDATESEEAKRADFESREVLEEKLPSWERRFEMAQSGLERCKHIDKRLLQSTGFESLLLRALELEEQQKYLAIVALVQELHEQATAMNDHPQSPLGLHEQLEPASTSPSAPSTLDAVRSLYSHLRTASQRPSSSSAAGGLEEQTTALPRLLVPLYKLCRLKEGLRNSQCSRLVSHIDAHIDYWSKTLRTRISSALLATLKLMGWPLGINSSVSITAPQSVSNPGWASLSASATPSPSSEPLPSLSTAALALERAKQLFGALLDVQLLTLYPAVLSIEEQLESNATANRSAVLFNLPSLWAMEALAAPVVQRFRFHFAEDRPTNRIDKPEWMFSHALQVIQDNGVFLHQTFGALLGKAGLAVYDARIEFVRILLRAVRAKVSELSTLILPLSVGSEAALGAAPDNGGEDMQERELHQLMLQIEEGIKNGLFSPESSNDPDKPTTLAAPDSPAVSSPSLSLSQIASSSKSSILAASSLLSAAIGRIQSRSGKLGGAANAAEQSSKPMHELIFSGNLALFAHLVNEASVFDHELRTMHDYPQHLPASLQVITDSPLWFAVWLTIEKHKSIFNYRSLFTAPPPAPWLPKFAQSRSAASRGDFFPVPESTELLVNQVWGVSERFQMVFAPHQRWIVLSLVVNPVIEQYLSDLELFAAESLSPLESLTHIQRVCYLVNGLWHLHTVLEEYSDHIFFLEANSFSLQRERPDDSPKNTHCFAGFCDRCADLKHSFLLSLRDHVVFTFLSAARLYEKQKWMLSFPFSDLDSVLDMANADAEAGTMPFSSATSLLASSAVLDLSPSLCEPLVLLRTHMNLLYNSLSDALFEGLWPEIAASLNDKLFDRIVRRAYFNQSGAVQLAFDMQKLLLLFRDHTAKPENFLKDIKEACILLNLSSATLREIRGLLHDVDQERAAAAAAAAAAASSKKGVVKSVSPAVSLKRLLESKHIFRMSEDTLIQLLGHYADVMTVE